MSGHDRSLIGSVFERTTPRAPSAPSSRFTGTQGIGFPTAQHRFKSAFARARDEVNGKAASSKQIDVPPSVSNGSKTHPSVVPTPPTIDPKPIPTDTDALLRQIHEENAHKLAQMSGEEIEQERHTILEQLGEGTGQLLRRVQEARRRKEAKEREAKAQAELEGKVAQEAQSKVDNARQTAQDGHDHELVALVADPTPRRASDGLAARPGILRVKSLDNIGHMGKFILDCR